MKVFYLFFIFYLVLCGCAYNSLKSSSPSTTHKPKRFRLPAGQDIKGPIADPSTLEVESTELRPGDVLRISIKITDDASGLGAIKGNAEVRFRDPNGGSFYFYADKQSSDGTITFEEAIDTYAADGEYTFSKMSGFSDKAGNRSKLPISQEVADKLKFRVINPNQDIKGPIADPSTLEVESTELRPGDVLRISIKITDDASGLGAIKGNAEVRFRDPNGGSFYFYADKQSSDGTITFEEAIDTYAADGEYTFSKMSGFSDKAGNRSKLPISQEVADKLKFRVINPNQDIKGPIADLSTLEVESTELRPGDVLRISIKITDDASGLGAIKGNAEVRFRDPNGGSFYFYADKQSSDGTITFEEAIDTYAADGEYTFSKMSGFSDKAGNRSKLPISQEVADKLKFRVVNPNSD